MKNLIIPVKIRMPGLYVYCNKCKRYSKKEDGYLRKSGKCNHPIEKQVYKIKVHVPASFKRCRTITLQTKEAKGIVKEYYMYKEQLEITHYEKSPKEEKIEIDRYLFLYQMKRYLDYLDNINTPEHMKKTLSSGTIKDYRRNFKYFVESLEQNNIDIKSLRIDQITDWHVELFHKYLVNQNKANKTYNNIMSSLKVFFGYMIKNEGLKFFDPFKLVRNKKVIRDTQTFSYTEFMSVIKSITPEAGMEINFKTKKKRNRYKPWLSSSIKLAAYCCLRLEELVYLKYIDIKISATEDYGYIEAENIKVNKQQGNKEKQEKQLKHIPLIAELAQVLQDDFALADNIGKDGYIIAPKLCRETVYNDMTKGFTHFKRIAKIDEKKCLKDLRTTYITNLQLTYNNAMITKAISDHSGGDIIFQHYFDKKQAAKVAKDFKVFKNDIL
jgi:integrase